VSEWSVDETPISDRDFGRYVLLDKLGEGGMGEVYLARDTEGGGNVAIKVLKPSLGADDKLVRRFWAEAKAAASINHEGIAQVLDVGRTDDGAAFLVMEYLRGETLRHRLCREGPLPEKRAVGFAKQLASVLAATHEQGIIHRDIKPENIFIVAAAEVLGGERLKLLDFGVAKLTDPVNTTNLTRTGDRIGTPMYMSPEQCRGTGEYDARTDLYALGCVLFEMICGRPPFVSKFPGDVMAAHISTPPPAASELRPRVSANVDGLVKRLLEKTPSNRVESATALRAALERLYDAGSTVFDSAPTMLRLAPGDDVAIAGEAGFRPSNQAATASLKRASGEVPGTSRESSTAQIPGRRRWPLFAAAMGALAVVGIILFFAMRGDATEEPAAAPLPAAAVEPSSAAKGVDGPTSPPAPPAPPQPENEEAAAKTPTDSAVDAAPPTPKVEARAAVPPSTRRSRRVSPHIKDPFAPKTKKKRTRRRPSKPTSNRLKPGKLGDEAVNPF